MSPYAGTKTFKKPHRVVGLEDLVDRLHQPESRPHRDVFHEDRAALLGGPGRHGRPLDVDAKDAERLGCRPLEALVVLEHHQPLHHV